MTPKTILRTAALLAAALLAVAPGAFSGAAFAASARTRHHRHDVMQAPPASGARAPIPYARSFYPEEIEGGVSGNLPFNNQIRKFKDPLGANGGK